MQRTAKEYGHSVSMSNSFLKHSTNTKGVRNIFLWINRNCFQNCFHWQNKLRSICQDGIIRILDYLSQTYTSFQNEIRRIAGYFSVIVIWRRKRPTIFHLRIIEYMHWTVSEYFCATTIAKKWFLRTEKEMNWRPKNNFSQALAYFKFGIYRLVFPQLTRSPFL